MPRRCRLGVAHTTKNADSRQSPDDRILYRRKIFHQSIDAWAYLMAAFLRDTGFSHSNSIGHYKCARNLKKHYLPPYMIAENLFKAARKSSICRSSTTRAHEQFSIARMSYILRCMTSSRIQAKSERWLKR